MVGVDEILFLNQVARGVRDSSEAREWYESQDVPRKQELLAFAIEMAKQAGAQHFDVPEAIARDGVKPTWTPCVMLGKTPLASQYHRLLRLPEDELTRALLAVLSLFSVANARRVEEHPENLERHWWNWDLSDDATLQRIRLLYEEGNL